MVVRATVHISFPVTSSSSTTLSPSEGQSSDEMETRTDEKVKLKQQRQKKQVSFEKVGRARRSFAFSPESREPPPGAYMKHIGAGHEILKALYYTQASVRISFFLVCRSEQTVLLLSLYLYFCIEPKCRWLLLSWI